MNDGKNLFNKPEAGSTMAEVVFPQQLPPTVLLSSFVTEKGHGQSVKFSPFDSNRIACAVGTEYGLQGKLQFLLFQQFRSNVLKLNIKVQFIFCRTRIFVCLGKKS